ncbi:hypothetical protein V6N11_080541 [Hibiscus sabdariffa]|uniref:non-specific serine/threonine protein kinase n=1 Tax=Hibiscus sabdariffa TaxID=183260 RepID=A0ABR2R8F3_9ROSI
MSGQVCHPDLKLENTLLDDSPAPRLKICDFGYSKSSVLHSQPKSTVGTPAPEVLLKPESQYDGKTADVWSCGVTLHILLRTLTSQKTIQRITNVQYSIPDFVQISPTSDFEDFCCRSYSCEELQFQKLKIMSVDTIMQIIAEATIPAAGAQEFNHLMVNSQLDDEFMDDFDSESESELDAYSSGEIVACHSVKTWLQRMVRW